MEEQTGSPGATAENTNQRNGDEVSVRHPAALSWLFSHINITHQGCTNITVVQNQESAITCSSVLTNTEYLIRPLHIIE